MRRRLIRMMLLLGLGAATTVGIAWLGAMLVNVEFIDQSDSAEALVERSTPPFVGRLWVQCSRGYGAVHVRSGVVGSKYEQPGFDFNGSEGPMDVSGPRNILTEIDAVLPKMVRRAALPWIEDGRQFPNEDSKEDREIGARGWPCLCLFNEYIVEREPRGLKISALGAIAVDRWLGSRTVLYILSYPIVLPYRPLWPGLLLNTAVFSLFWWTVWKVWTAVRRARLRIYQRHGRCPVCRYDLTATRCDMPCPECGRTPSPSAA